MVRFRLLFLAILPLLAVHAAMAGNFAVGGCKPTLPSFAMISDAVSSVPPGSTIFVCPGIYPEQVTISQPLTLEGIASSNQDQAVIAAPSTGLVANTTSVFLEPVAAQVLVQSVGPVNIINITVDGSGGDLGCSGGTWVAGIFYASSSSGLVSRVKASGQINGNCGVGIWAENGDNSKQYVTVEGSSVHDIDSVGIFASSSNSTPNLFATIKGNVVSMNNTGLIGIALNDVTGAVTANDVSNAMFGIVDVGAEVSLSSNTVSETGMGIALQGGGTVSLNRIFNSSLGVWFFADGGIVQFNRITSTSVAAVELNCSAAIVAHNTINDAVIGLHNAPLSVTGSNTFYNTATMRTSECATASVRANAAQSASSKVGAAGASIWQWRTPASPQGSLK
jgi:hypothetical protein